MDKKVFSEEEVKEIIKKAAELQKSSGEKNDDKTGLSLDELMNIGQEAGLDVNFIKTAALEFENGKVSTHSGLTDTHIFEERAFESDVPEHVMWDDVVAELTHHFGGNAFGKTSKGANSWTHNSVSGIETIVSLTKRSNSAKLRLSQRVGLGSPLTEGIMYGGGLTFLIMVVVTAFSSLPVSGIAALSAGLWSLSSVMVYQLDVLWRKKKLRGLKELATKIVSQLPKNAASIKTQKQKNTSEIEIESEEVYKNSETEGFDLRNDLKEKS